MNLWVKLPEKVSSVELFERCRDRKVIFTPGTVFIKGDAGEKHIRISFAAASLGQIAEGISIIGNLMEEIKDSAK